MCKRWLIGGVAAALVVGGIAWAWAPSRAPACTSRRVTGTLMRIAIDLNMRAATRLGGERPAAIFTDPREIGYDGKTRTRGCAANFTSDGKGADMKVGFLIQPTKDDFEVKTVPYDYVEARFSPAALNGSPGAPVGRQAIHDALLGALGRIDARAGAPRSILQRTLPGVERPATLAASVIDVVPTGDCHALDARRYACPLSIGYEDFLLRALGTDGFLTLNGDFVYAKDDRGWTMADGFDKTFASALEAARVARVYGPRAGAKQPAQLPPGER